MTEVASNSKVFGMVAYIEPQCFIKNCNYVRDEKSDIYALGVLFWEITSGRPPFTEINQELINIHISEGNREKPVEDTPLEYQQLYEKCWDTEPNLRPDIEEVYEILTKIKSQFETSNQVKQSLNDNK